MWRSWSFIIILLWIAMALMAPLVSDLADRIQLETLLLSPFQHAPLGTDELGHLLRVPLMPSLSIIE